jgi:hypothetical protein
MAATAQTSAKISPADINVPPQIINELNTLFYHAIRTMQPPEASSFAASDSANPPVARMKSHSASGGAKSEEIQLMTKSG